MLWPRTMRGLWSWEPWEEMRRLQRQMNRLSGDVLPGVSRRVFPPVNIWTGRDDIIVTAELPGVDPQKVEISVVGDTLTISGSREGAELKEGESFSRQERETGVFSRTIQLPFRVGADKVEASYARGVLRITLPRLEAEKPKQVPIKAAK